MYASKESDKKHRVDMVRHISESGEELCPVCSDVIKIFAVGECNHCICFRCSTRMRVLCNQMYCAICRADLPKVAFTQSGEWKFEELNLSSFGLHQNHKIFFENESLKLAFFELQEHKCRICVGFKSFRTFHLLREHMRKEHSLFCCDLCAKHIKIFSSERKFYNRKSLGEHRRVGDPDDRSHKGHPLCKFCDERYLDNDELLKHLRKHHYYCHFCEADGISNEYYDTYSFLREHFRDSHYLCEEDDCYHVEFTNAFRDEIDYKAHKAAMHSKNLKKAMAKAARTLDIDFNLARRAPIRSEAGVTRHDDCIETRVEDSRRGAYGRGRLSRLDRQRQREEEDIQRALTASLNQATLTSVSVVDPSLLKPTSLTGSKDCTLHKMTNDEGGDKAEPKNEKKKSKHSSQEQKQLFRETGRNEGVSLTRNDKVKDMRDGSHLDVDEYRAVQAEKISTAPQEKEKVVTHFSAEFDVMERDFPSLMGEKPSVANYPQIKQPCAAILAEPVEDFPSLVGKTKSSSATARPKSIVSVWNKSAAAVRAKAVTTKATTLTKRATARNAQGRCQEGAMAESDRISPSLGMVGRAKGPEMGGSATEEYAKYASSATTAQPIKSNIKVVKEISDIESYLVSSSKQSASKPGLSRFANSFNDFPVLVGKENANTKHIIQQTSPWGPKTKQIEDSSLKKTHGDSGMLKMKTKQKKRINDGSAPISSTDQHTNEVSKTEVKADSGNSSNQLRGSKTKTKKKEEDTFGIVENSPDTSSSTLKIGKTAEETEVDKNTTEDAVKVFLKHLKEEMAKQDSQAVENEGKKLKSKKKKKIDKIKTSRENNIDNSFVKPAQISGKKSATVVSAEKSGAMSSVKTDASQLVCAASKIAEATEDSEMAKTDMASVVTHIPTNLTSTSFDECSPSVSSSAIDLDDFPALTGSQPGSLLGIKDPVSKDPPPGFRSAVMPKPPPGFGGEASVPPGFHIGISHGGSARGVLGHAARDPAVHATMSVEPHVASAALEYTKPIDFEQRNQNLIKAICKFVNELQFREFKRYSSEFRHGVIDALCYHKECSLSLGQTNFEAVFPELLVLLPDITKQQELLKAHTDCLKNDPVAKLSGVSKLRKIENMFYTCVICQQVLLTNDLNEHMTKHSNESEFPPPLK